MDDLKNILSPEDYEELKLAGLVDRIESGDYMPDYLDWLAVNRPELYLNWPHVQYIGKYLQDVIDGKIKKLMIHVHPRIGKSTLVTESIPVYLLAKNPRNKVIIAAYGQTLATKFSTKCRSFAERIGIVLNPQKRARDEWEILDYSGGVRAVGVGTGVAGYGASGAIIIDDPVKSRKEANSPTYREATYDWYTNDLFTRRDNDDVPIIYIGTKWHDEDLGGMILANEGEWSPENPNGWVVIRLPALAEENDPLGREVGEALCPDRYNRDQLLQIKQVLGQDFYSLYQCRPQAREGSLVKKSYFKFIEYLPKEEYGSLDYFRAWDKAASEEITADYTASILLAYSRISKNIYILDAFQFRAGTYERDQRMVETARKDHIQYGNVRIIHEQEPGSGGKDQKVYTAKLLQGFNVRSHRPTTNKISRFEPFLAQLEAGNVFLKKADWNREFINNLVELPFGKHDHFADCCSMAFNASMGGNAFIRIGGKI